MFSKNSCFSKEIELNQANQGHEIDKQGGIPTLLY